MTTILAFDTATIACSAALSIDGEVTELFELAPRRHGELLLPMIDRLLRDAALRIDACDAIAFGRGPGSFMGLRIAAGIAQGLAFGAGIPVIPISSLQALAQTAFWQVGREMILAGWDARMQQLYWGLYQADEGRMEAVIPDQLTAPGEICVPENTDITAGNAWEVYRESLSPGVANIPHIEEDVYPSAKAIAFLAEAAERIMPQDIDLSYLRNKVADVPSR